MFGFGDAADDGALHADGLGGFDVHLVVVQEEDAETFELKVVKIWKHPIS